MVSKGQHIFGIFLFLFTYCICIYFLHPFKGVDYQFKTLAILQKFTLIIHL